MIQKAKADSDNAIQLNLLNLVDSEKTWHIDATGKEECHINLSVSARLISN